MLLKKWEEFPPRMQNGQVRPYYDLLKKKTASLLIKRLGDILFALVACVVLSPILLITALLVRIDSKGPVFFRQVRVGAFLQEFRIFKFRTMVDHADKIGSQVTVKNDSRITRIGSFLRKYRLDELPQLFNILLGQMTVIGARPEVVKYVEHYTDEMLATLLLPPGLSCEASIHFRNENELLGSCQDVDRTYIEEILPVKLSYSLEYMKKSFFREDIKLFFRTIGCAFHMEG